MFLKPYISNFCELEPARLAEKNKEIPYEDDSRIILSLLHSFFVPGYVVKIKLNSICLRPWPSWQSTLTEPKFPTGFLGLVPDEDIPCYSF